MKILLVGAAGALGLRIAQRLSAGEHTVTASYRTEKPAALEKLKRLGCALVRLDLSAPDPWVNQPEFDLVIFTPILSVSGPAARALPVATRSILFSSNNVVIDPEAPVYQTLRDEERALFKSDRTFVLIRPTMIYGHPDDGNLSRVMRLAKRSPLLPVPGSGHARQAPIHIDDLADLTVSLAQSVETSGVFSASGPDTLRTIELYRLIARSARAKTLIVPIPKSLLQLAASLLPLPLNKAQIDRANLDRLPPDGSAPPDWRAQISIEAGLKELAEMLDAEP